MCRFLLYKARDSSQAALLSDLVVRPSHSIIRQSFACRERLTEGVVPAHLNGDGFGIGWYTDPPPCAATPAAGDVEADSRFAGPTAGACAGAAPAAGAGGSDAGAGAATGSAKRRRTAASTPSAAAGGVPADVVTCDDAGSAAARPAPAACGPLDCTPGVYTSTAPAWNNLNLVRLSDKIRSSLIFAHVRAATVGSPVTEANCHPFAVGRYMMMHNGFVAGFQKIRLRMLQFMSEDVFSLLNGTCDSEHCFGVFLTLVAQHGSFTTVLKPGVFQACVAKMISLLQQWLEEAKVQENSLLNFAVTDGSAVVATRVALGGAAGASLYFSSGSAWEESDTEAGEYRMLHADRREHVVIVASERLSAVAEDWVEIPNNHIMLVKPNMTVLIVPLEEAYDAATISFPTAPAAAPVTDVPAPAAHGKLAVATPDLVTAAPPTVVTAA